MPPRTTVIDFFYDIGSMYSYFALEALRRYCFGGHPQWNSVKLRLRPFLLGGVFKATGNQPPISVPARAPYLMKDIQRNAFYGDLKINMPPEFPSNTVKAMRLLTSVAMEGNEGKLMDASVAIFRAYWEKEADIKDPKQLQEALISLGGFAAQEAKRHTARIDDSEVKNRLKEETQEAVERGAFGAPSIFVPASAFSPQVAAVAGVQSESPDEEKPPGEMFFGSDRLPVMAHMLGLPWEGPAGPRSLGARL
uniref:Glutathione S-transferase kappa n=2 Tax=Chromera velia TaxID=505693 RepID=A0A2K8DNW4_9ALVE|nr:Glutathione S-transferase kappa 1 [Chromera velia]|mmetsp:Transcript_14967/g.30253  ORF Transcript_14967/g.30253 Transcript_14967/m.30253 type:complete len:251 (+) Transcript_14967:185-937(+)|eukprot:Cvel_29286.t1-p1 / transcript=Cvel_29286.t1 / gene=Cvel_29286 / organism=Chromera_velia_CCMP2878 / gene_product=Glutathione S-transferase kappa 1, putative / transcript_product=Glutathione S-transferase kappa 1, putative / location=Cvel_scaffold3979:3685-7584(+) / protein_length=250 / sequence_SO=supercontig / SO=protein_coding / is_pseudo=false